jgi:hypothetical protein
VFSRAWPPDRPGPSQARSRIRRSHPPGRNRGELEVEKGGTLDGGPPPRACCQAARSPRRAMSTDRRVPPVASSWTIRSMRG